jgi:CheY-like chemotaxis protein
MGKPISDQRDNVKGHISPMLTNMRILTVDDSATIRMFMRVLLARHGASVAEAATGEAAMAAVMSGEHFDLILLDLILPDADGIDLLRTIRAVDQSTPIVMLTGMGGVKSATTAVQEGADGYIEKQELAAGADHANSSMRCNRPSNIATVWWPRISCCSSKPTSIR